jgi:hypothetical protein
LDLFEQSSLEVKLIGNCPFAVLKYKYPKPVAERLKSIGKQIYYFKGQLKDGDLQKGQWNEEIISDFSWLTRDECKEVFKSKYWRSISSGLLIEGPNPKTLDHVLRRVQNKLKRLEQVSSGQRAVQA